MKRKVQLRPVVQWFAEQMELALRRNDFKGGWDGDSPEELAERIAEDLEELTVALNRRRSPHGWERVRLEATDVANMAMMVADHARLGGPSRDQGGTL